MPKLTERYIKTIEPPPRGKPIHWDSELSGFGLKVTSLGTRSWFLNYRLHGRERRVTVGRHPSWSAVRARAEATKLRRMVDLGLDPLAERDAVTLAQLVERYRREHWARLSPATIKQRRTMLTRYILPTLGRHRVDSIQFADIERLHRSMAAQPVLANRTVDLLSALFNYSIKLQLRETNPVRGVTRNREHPREQYLTGEQLQRLSQALDEYPNATAANIIRLQLLTGCRGHEARQMRWDDIDLDAGIWRKPSTSTKQRRPHNVPLSGAVLALVRAQPRTSEFVFPAPDGKPYSTTRHAWDVIRERAQLTGYTQHSLRHSFASMLAGSGASLLLIGRMLGHSRVTTTQRYAHLVDNQLRDAADHVAAVIDGTQRANVAKIKK